jgi:hypothetical protein
MIIIVIIINCSGIILTALTDEKMEKKCIEKVKVPATSNPAQFMTNQPLGVLLTTRGCQVVLLNLLFLWLLKFIERKSK